ncbi:2Fe-2S iron-sulfur cluster-binding protein [Sphingomonas profundi]|uniref:2Fe-2S iron-sulfur cluster-binding protein n=1 Tax=Alterirhizorhabdus profundi TaxID=2681549 RepID=UPI0012E8BE0D|nr:2Fe-2S iron-sulfur cluster-binding protein [Sphingomonas profundi]
MRGPYRAADGGETVSFSFDGVPLKARPGDTLAAALLANGIGLVGRSFKYHRPRGIMAAGVEEPNALVTVGEGGRAEPNTRATDLFVYDGLVATSQNHWLSLSHDAGAVIGLASRALPAGFYYKTFFGPAKRWLRYEVPIRRAAGLGKAPAERDPDGFAQRAGFCDVLVVGAGPAGLKAALDAAEGGARVMLVEQDAVLGASLIRDPEAGRDPAWIEAAAARIRALGGRILTRTTASGYWDHNFVTLAERLVEPGAIPPHGIAQRLWHVRAGKVILATGALERPIPFSDNDRPGVMLSQAVRTYVRRFGVVPGRRVVIATNNDDAYRTADALAEAGADVVAILDARPAGSGPASPYPTHFDARPAGVSGTRHHLKRVTALVGGREQGWEADLLAVSGGFVPVVHLHMQAGGKLDWNEAAQAFVPGPIAQACVTVGGAADPPPAPPVTPAGAPKKSFVDFQNDVTLADVDLAWQEGYRSVEHLKRYTTLGMATDQGKTSNIVALSRLAEKQGVAVPDAGVTTFRPPYTPVTMGVLAGTAAKSAGAHVRRLPLHDAHARHKPVWQPTGHWFRPRAYPLEGETTTAAAMREAKAVRQHVGLTDVSTLAKFEVSGPDAAALLELVCATAVATLKTGRGRYTFMLREDGMVFDDGTVWRIADDRYLLTSSTGGADRMATHLSYVRNTLRPEMRVSVVNVQEHHAAVALAGPRAKAIVETLTGGEPPRHMSAARATLAGVPVLVLAASYSGERAFEIYAEATAALPVWSALAAAVAAAGGGPYGLDAMDLLRIEKGHVLVGGEVDGRTTPDDMGLRTMLNKAGGYIGAAGLQRPALSETGRLQLVGLEALDGAILEGAMLIAAEGETPHGHVTAAGRRVADEGSIALALLRDGRARHGETLIASSPMRGASTRVRVAAPHFYDAAGERYRG